MIRAFAVAMAAAAFTAAAPALARQDKAPAAESSILNGVIDPIVLGYLKDSGAPGAGVVVVHQGRVVFLKGYGEADREARRPSGADTVWPIASITKVLTAIGVMQQVEHGRMRLDADIGRYLGGLKIPAAYGRPIIVADALRHTSGLDELPGRRIEHPPGDAKLTQFLDGKLVRYRAPGETPSYSSYGMAVAGAALEEVTGQPYADYVRRSVFGPLGLSASRVMVRAADARGVAAPYELEDGRAARIAYEWYATPQTSSAAMSLRDLSRLLLDLTAQRPRLLSRDSLNQMMDQQSGAHAQIPGWGYGFQLDRVNGRRVAEHGGDIGGFASLLSILPDERFAIFVVSHGEGSNMRFKLRDAVVGALFPAPPVRLPPTVRADLSPYLGKFRASTQCHSCKTPTPAPEFEVEPDGKGGLRLWGTNWTPIGPDLFADPLTGRKIVFLRDSAGAVTTVAGASWRVGERVKE